jgi:GH15 family glucan-1,4-alpha-glucosidase
MLSGERERLKHESTVGIVGRQVILSNGNLLVGLDDFATVHDFYYPYVGQENLTTARNLNHKIGVWVDGKFSWIDDGSWRIDIDFEAEALISNITAVNDGLKITLKLQDFVDYHYPVLGRQIEVGNLSSTQREVRIFMHQAFQISRAGRSDTALYVPDGPYLLDYKGWSSLLIYMQDANKTPFDQFAVGNYGIEGKEGTFKDAEDGELSGSLVEHGGVDSVIRSSLILDNGQSSKLSYWVVAADSQTDAEKIHKAIQKSGLEDRLEATRRWWGDWLAQAGSRLESGRYTTLAKKSLMLVKGHQDRHGGLIASSDSSIYNYGRDYYNYVWPRDGAYTLMPLIELGYKDEPKKFFQFCIDTMNPAGYMMHKYQPDRSIGSTWHPLLHLNRPELPIQEDETAIVLYAINRYFEVSKDEDYIRSIYTKFIQPCSDFMSGFMDVTNLPHASYDLWEERFATFTYTSYVTLAALEAAAGIANKLGKHDDHEKWTAAAERLKRGLPQLVNDDGAFRKSILLKPDLELEYDDTIDASSFYGAFIYGSQDEAVPRSVRRVEDSLMSSSAIGGVPRYENDNYFRKHDKSLGNPWIITTLWLAQYYIKLGDRQKAAELIDWTLARASNSGMLAEQADPDTGIAVGVCPLVWSHSTFVETIIMLNN